MKLTDEWKWYTPEDTLAEGSKEVHFIYAQIFSLHLEPMVEPLEDLSAVLARLSEP